MKCWSFILSVISVNLFVPTLQVYGASHHDGTVNFKFSVPSERPLVRNTNDGTATVAPTTQEPSDISTCNVPVQSFDDEFLTFLERIGLNNLQDAEVEDLKNLFVVLLNPDALPTEEPTDSPTDFPTPVDPVTLEPATDAPNTDDPMEVTDATAVPVASTTRRTTTRTTRRTTTRRTTTRRTTTSRTTTRRTTTRRATTRRAKFAFLNIKAKATTRRVETTRPRVQVTVEPMDRFDQFLEALGVDPNSSVERDNLLRLFEQWQESQQGSTTTRMTTRRSKLNALSGQGSGKQIFNNLPSLKPQQGGLFAKNSTPAGNNKVRNILQNLKGMLNNKYGSPTNNPKPQLNFGNKPPISSKVRNLTNKLNLSNKRNQNTCDCATCFDEAE